MILLPLESLAAPSIANHLWQSTLFALLAATLTVALRTNHAKIRFGLWLTASVKFLLPFSLLIGLGSHIASQRPSDAGRTPFYLMIDRVSQPFSALPQRADLGSRSLSLLPEMLDVVWLAGMAAVLSYWWVRWRRVAAIIRAAQPVLQSREIDILRQLERIDGRQKPIPLLLSQESMEPGVCGILRPALLWPAGFSEHLPDAHLRAILAHELGHVQRGDNLAAALHMFVEAVFWFHPLVWWMGSRMVEERERACDEEVLQLGSQPEVYAESILKACKFCVEAPLSCISGVAGSNLKRRITRIMNPHSAQNLTLTRKLLLAVLASAAIAGPVAIGVFHTPQLVAQSLHGASALSAVASAPPMSFETVSAKPSQAEGSEEHMDIRPNVFNDTNVTVRKLIAFAYGINNYQIVGAPEWIDSQRYDIQATWKEAEVTSIPGPPPPPSPPGAPNVHLLPYQLQSMVQTLLREQFHLKWSEQLQELPTYELQVANNGPRLTATATTPPPPTFHGEQVVSVRTQMEGGVGNIVMQNAPPGALAGFLAMQLDRPVIDKTGIKGNYDMNLRWVTGQDKKENIAEALEQQLGLKLEPREGPVDLLAVTQIEKPEED